jgi:hypothetical protein
LRAATAPEIRPLVGTPAWTAAGRVDELALTRGDEKAAVDFAWEAVGDAASYRIEVATDEAMTHPALGFTVAAPAHAARANLDAGTYFARVRATGKDGLPGAISAPKTIRVVRTKLPHGAFVADGGVVVMPPNAALGLEPLTDLAVAPVIGDTPVVAKDFAPLSDALRFGDAKARTFRIRDTRTGAEAQVSIARRELRARIAMSPAKAHWPEDPIDVTVKVEDPSGRCTTRDEEVALEVRIDGAVEPTKWTRDGNTYRARIAPHIPPGPWQVEVRVHDAARAEIGDAFADVDGPRAGRGKRVADFTNVRVVPSP